MVNANPINSQQALGTSDNVTHAVINSSISATGNCFKGTTSDASATAAPLIELFRNSNSPAISDFIGGMICTGKSSTGVTRTYASAAANIIDPANTAEKAGFIIGTMSAGTMTTQLNVLDTGCQVRGNNAVTAPPAGYLGELLSATATTGALTSNVTVNITSISLTAGIWDVQGYVEFNTTGTVAGNTQYAGAISTTSASLTGTGENGTAQTGGTLAVSGVNGIGFNVGATRVTVAAGATTTIYLNARGFASSTFTNVTATGVIRGVRVG